MEEDPLKAELQQAQAELAQVQATEATLDDKYYKQLNALPAERVITRIPLAPNGRFSFEDANYAEGETQHHFWIFTCATRPDGRQYWALGDLTIDKNHTLPVVIEPAQFVSTKALLRPNLSPDEQEQ